MAALFTPGARQIGATLPFLPTGRAIDAFGTPIGARPVSGPNAGLVQVLIVDGDAHCLRRFAGAVQSDAGLNLLEAVSTGEAALRSLARRRPDVMVVEPGLTDMCGLTLIRQCAAWSAGTDILVRTQVGDDEKVLASIEAGAAGYLYRDAAPDWIVASIHALRAGGALVSPGVARRILSRFRLRTVVTGHSGFGGLEAEERSALSDNDIGVLRLVACGTALHDIGDILGLSPIAVLEHVKGIYRQLAVRGRTGALPS